MPIKAPPTGIPAAHSRSGCRNQRRGHYDHGVDFFIDDSPQKYRHFYVALRRSAGTELINRYERLFTIAVLDRYNDWLVIVTQDNQTIVFELNVVPYYPVDSEVKHGGIVNHLAEITDVAIDNHGVGLILVQERRPYI